MAVVYPLYAPGGYLQIGEVKYYFFRNVTLVTLAALCVVVVPAALAGRDRNRIVRLYRQMSVTDWCVYGYCLAVMLSYLCCAYKETALWGAEGWYMGVVSQLMFVLLYFFFSRWFCCKDSAFAAGGYGKTGAGIVEAGDGAADGSAEAGRWVGLWLFTSAIVFLLGICNRYSVYPIAMEGQTETFISTLGNINWFCGYWSVTAPIGITLYWCGRRGLIRALLGAYSFLAMLSGITQGSNSAYLVYLFMVTVFFVFSWRDRKKLYRFLELGMLFGSACQVGRLLQKLPGFTYNYWNGQPEENRGITGILIGNNTGAGILFLLAGCYIAVRMLDKSGRLRPDGGRRLRGILIAAAIGGCLGSFLLLTNDGVVSFWKMGVSMESDGYLKVIPDDDWGNGRGAAWNCGVNAYREMDSLHKIVGAGPDCFADYIYDVPKLAERMRDEFANQRLTNAHNEWLTVLINTGALGLLCYVGIYATAIMRFAKRAGRKPLLCACAMALSAYMVHNMVSFQQILSTPYIFIVLGIGEGLVREDGDITGE
ncbi:MAG: O-antigen ligase family protein [Lachnospiraceae bacterium]|nr:O-antigen ligase family protein [Lachnospiraceae bacterium]